MKNLIIILFVFFIYSSSAQINRYIRKASKASEKGNIELAKTYYLKAYQTDTANYNANLGLGNILSEFMNRYDEAIPYLERACAKSTPDTLEDLIYALGKSYHHVGQYEKALALYKRLDGTVALVDDNEAYQAELKKRKEDCLYGMEHREVADPKDLYVVNVGPKINTAMPEYVPVLTPSNELIFTSRRKDSSKEKPNELDGKYFESMYITKLENGKPQSIRRYTLPDLYLKSKFRKHHESIVSMSPNGKTLFIYRDLKIFEINIDSVTKAQPTRLSNTINFDYYQGHASLTKDGRTLYFTCESDGGIGGIDIYKSVKNEDGTWGRPENLGTPVNSELDEDSPYLTADEKSLYFASKGHPGYGGYDIYKSTLVDGKWSTPQNLSQPINSPGNDVFMIEKNENNDGFFSSSRKGGYGDMDIYKVTYLKNANKQCVEANNVLVNLNKTIVDEEKGIVKFNAEMPPYFKPLEYVWSVNNSVTTDISNEITTTFANKTADNLISVKIVNFCDTCLDPLVACNFVKFKFKEDVLVSNVPKDTTKGAITTTPLKPDTGGVIASTYDGTNKYDEKLKYNYISKDNIVSIGFDLDPLHFNLNKFNLRDDAVSILEKNIQVLKEHKDLKVIIYGFTDSRGTNEYNLKLSKKRAQRVKKYLIGKGLDARQIKAVYGKGEKYLLNECSNGVKCDEVKHEQNRRVEFVVIQK